MAAKVGVTGRVKWRPRALMLARWLLVIVLAWSAGGKVFWPEKLRDILRTTGLVPPEWLGLLAYGLPAVEMALALGLATHRIWVPALLGSIFLSSAFAAVHAYLLACGRVVPRGCAGVAINFESRWFHAALLALSLLLLGASIALLMAETGQGRTPPHGGQ